MSTLEILHTGWFTGKHEVRKNGVPVAKMDMSNWREKGILTIGNTTYEVFRERMRSNRFDLVSNGAQLAHAEKQRILSRTFNIEHAGRTFTMRKQSIFLSRFVLRENDRVIGTVKPKGLFKRSAVTELPDELPLPLVLFVAWIALILWKRQTEASAATMPGG